MADQHSSVPLCVDLDGTLIHSDLLLESFLLLIKQNPLYLLWVPIWLLGGKANLKAQIASRVAINGAALPYNQEFVAWLKTQRDTGRSLWLCTASDIRLAQAVAQHIGLFEGVLASDGQLNLSGRNKAKVLSDRFGAGQFDYCGNAMVDMAVWQAARSAVVVNASKVVIEKAKASVQVGKVIESSSHGWRVISKALRVHQWAKNALIFVPVLAGHRFDTDTVMASFMAFMAFSLCASSVYLLNDMLDLEADRMHHSKCRRPFASGQLSLLFGLVCAPFLLVLALVFALTLPPMFLGVLAAYYVVTVAYSFGLKKVVMVDVLTLAGLYTVRIVAGSAATGIPLTFWLLIFAIFIFLSLALVKRYAELRVMREEGKLAAQGRGYQVDDLALLQNLGASSGYLSVLVLALYLNSPDVMQMYHHPKFGWLLVPVMLYWISRVWMQAHRGNMHDDPLVYALKDRTSLLTGLAGAVALYLAI